MWIFNCHLAKCIKMMPLPVEPAMLLEDPDRIEPRFNVPGWYYDRHTKFCWMEAAGYAWKSHKSSFLYALEQLNHRPLRDVERGAIRTLMLSKLAPRSMRKLFYVDRDWWDMHRVFQRARVSANRIISRREHSVNQNK